MPLSRRTFLKDSARYGAGIVLTAAAAPFALFASAADPVLSRYITGARMAATPATHFRPYRSRSVTDPSLATWVQIDLGVSRSLDAIELYPASYRMYPGLDAYYAGESFPLRFRIELANDPSFQPATPVVDFSHADFPDVADWITRFPTHGLRGRYVRVTATKLRAVMQAFADPTPTGHLPERSSEFTLSLSKIGVLSGNTDVAVGCVASADPEHGNPPDLQQLTRPARQDGEQIIWDNPQNVSAPTSWRPVVCPASTPRSGVVLGEGPFRSAMRNNIVYLLDSYTTNDLLRQFDERAGTIRGFRTSDLAGFWEEDLAGSNTGRFLMGAGNTVRWIAHPELEQRITAVVDGVARCGQPDGYIMAYPAETMFFSERAAYTRAWLTHGLLEAAYAGNGKALPLLRGYYDWYNRQEKTLPLLLRGAVQGGQGAVANTRMGLSPAGKPEDFQIIQRYFEEPEFLKGLSARDPSQIWQYPYDRPHCYLLTILEAYTDLYLATGERRYIDAVLGAWQLYRDNWQQPGGSISIIEFQENPPGSNFIHQDLGELCGSSFWVFLNQRLNHLHPEDERYAGEIESTLYNIALANQDAGYGLRYHTHLEGKKEQATRENTCCEGQGTRLIGSLPEHIYSLAEDGIYLNLFAASTITWEQAGKKLTLRQETSFPFDDNVHCILHVLSPTATKVRIRVPAWVEQTTQVLLNGKTAANGVPGSYVTLDRLWSNGDSIDLRFPMQLRLAEYRGSERTHDGTRFSLTYGPLLFAVTGAASVKLDISPDDLVTSLRRVSEQSLHYKLASQPSLTWMPYWQVSDEDFTCFPVLRWKTV